MANIQVLESTIIPGLFPLEFSDVEFSVENDVYTFTGELAIGYADDSVPPFIDIDGTVIVDSTQINMDGGFSVTGIPIFDGVLTIPLGSSTSSSVIPRDGGDSFSLSGLDISLTQLTIEADGFDIAGGLTLPTDVWGGASFNVNDLSWNSTDGFSLSTEITDIDADFDESWGFQLDDFTIEYINPEDLFKLQGALTLETPVGDISANLAGDNKIEIKDGQTTVIGNISADTIVFEAGVWELQQPELAFDIEGTSVSVTTSGTLLMPGGAILTLDNVGWDEDSITIDISTSAPIPETNLVIETLKGELQVLNGVALNNGELKLKTNDEVSFNILDQDYTGSTFSADMTATINSSMLDGVVKELDILGGVFTSTNAEFMYDWSCETAIVSADSFNVLDGLVELTNGEVKLDYSDGLSLSIQQGISFDWSEILGTDNIFLGFISILLPDNANFSLYYDSTQPSSNNYVQVTSNVFILGNIGFKVGFDGSFHVIGGIAASLFESNVMSSNLESDTFETAEDDSLLHQLYSVPEHANWFIVEVDWDETLEQAPGITLVNSNGEIIPESDYDVQLLQQRDVHSEVILIHSEALLPGQLEVLVDIPENIDPSSVEITAWHQTDAPLFKPFHLEVISENEFRLTWEAFDSDSEAMISFYLNNNNSEFNGVKVGVEIEEKDGINEFILQLSDQELSTLGNLDEAYLYAIMEDSNSHVETAYFFESFSIENGQLEPTVEPPTLILGTNKDDVIQATVNQKIVADNGDDNIFSSPINSSDNLLFGGYGNDTLMAAKNDRLFGEAGEDLLDATAGMGGNFLYGGYGKDELLAGTNDVLYGGYGADTLDASAGGGNNVIYGENGYDTFFLGSNDTLFGDWGWDQFFAISGGGNTITGGRGNDQFWIANAQIPESANTITDFTSGEDVIGIGGLNITFEDLTFTQQGNYTSISLNGDELAILQGIESSNLSTSDFVFV